MKTLELRIGNLVYDDYESVTEVYALTISEVNNDDMTHLYTPIPLTEEWLLKLPEGLKFPEWIKSVHELQNWHYWNNNKKELTIK